MHSPNQETQITHKNTIFYFDIFNISLLLNYINRPPMESQPLNNLILIRHG